MTIKEDSELQHALAHLWLAVDHLVRGEEKAAAYELDSIAGLIFFDDDAQRVEYLEAVKYGEEEPETKTSEPLPESETAEADEDPAR